MNKEELQAKINTINRLIGEVRAFKDAYPQHKLGYYPGSCGSLLNAYREGDIDFYECVKLLTKEKVMGATIYLKQVNPKDKESLGVGAPSAFIDAMNKAFGDSPWRLDARHVATLKGMAAVHGGDGWSENPFERLIQAIERLDTIDVWPEW